MPLPAPTTQAFLDSQGRIDPTWLRWLSDLSDRKINGAQWDASGNLTIGVTDQGGGGGASPGTVTIVASVAAAAETLTGTTLAPGVTNSSLTRVGVLVAGSTGAGFTIALSASTITGTLPDGALSGNVALLNAVSNTFTGALTVTGTLTVGGHLLPSLTDTSDLGSPSRIWRQGYLAQLNAIVFALQTQTLFGGYSTIGKNAGTFAAAVAAVDAKVDFGQAMTVGDFVLVRAHDTAGLLKAEYLQVGALDSGTLYNVTRDLAAANSPDPAWAAGTPYLVLGASGDGRIDLFAYDGKPRVIWTLQGATYNAQTIRAVVGNLNGAFGYVSDIYGAAFGDATGPWVKIDPTNGVRIGYNTTTAITIDGSGNPSITLGTPAALAANNSYNFALPSGCGGAGSYLGMGSVYAANALVLAAAALPRVTDATAKDARVAFSATGRTAGDVAYATAGLTLTSWGTSVNASLNAGSYVITLDSTGLITIPGQLAFPSVQNASTDPNTLDDYEENTAWTPTLVSSGGGAPTYTTQTGSYIKVGKKVTFAGRITLTNKGTLGAGTLTIALPFTPESGFQGAAAVGYYGNMVTNIIDMRAFIQSAASLHLYRTTGAGVALTALQDTDVAATFDVIFAGSFMANA